MRQGAGVGGSDRVTITWDDNVIQNQWLQVTVKADANTGLAAADVFYFGNAIGESGDNPANAVVDFQDELASRTHKSGIPIAPITNPYDYNRDGRVNATDDIIARHNRTDGTGGNPLQLISSACKQSVGGRRYIAAGVVVGSGNRAGSNGISAYTVAVGQSGCVCKRRSRKFERCACRQVRIGRGQCGSRSCICDASRPAPAAGHFAAPGNSAYLVPTLRRGNARSLVPELRFAETGSHSGAWEQGHSSDLMQDSLHDAIFTHSIVQHLLTEDSLPDDSSAPADIETLINDCLSGKTDKSLTHAIDTVMVGEGESVHNQLNGRKRSFVQ